MTRKAGECTGWNILKLNNPEILIKQQNRELIYWNTVIKIRKVKILAWIIHEIKHFSKGHEVLFPENK